MDHFSRLSFQKIIIECVSMMRSCFGMGGDGGSGWQVVLLVVPVNDARGRKGGADGEL